MEILDPKTAKMPESSSWSSHFSSPRYHAFGKPGAASRPFIPYASVKPIFDEYREQLPADLKNLDEAKWIACARRHDFSIRAPLRQGDLDSR